MPSYENHLSYKRHTFLGLAYDIPLNRYQMVTTEINRYFLIEEAHLIEKIQKVTNTKSIL